MTLNTIKLDELFIEVLTQLPDILSIAVIDMEHELILASAGNGQIDSDSLIMSNVEMIKTKLKLCSDEAIEDLSITSSSQHNLIRLTRDKKHMLFLAIPKDIKITSITASLIDTILFRLESI